MFEKTRKATTLNRSFLSPSRLFSPSHRRGREEGQNCCKTKEMDRNESCNLPLRHRSPPAPPPLRFMLRCSVIFLFQRFLFFSIRSRRVHASFVCFRCRQDHVWYMCTLLRFTSSLSLFLLSLSLVSSLSLSLLLSYSLILFLLKNEKKRKEKDRKKKK